MAPHNKTILFFYHVIVEKTTELKACIPMLYRVITYNKQYIILFSLWKEKGKKNTYTSNVIIIIMSCRQHGYSWPSLATSPYHSSLPAGLRGYIPCPHIVAVCKFELVVLLLHDHMWGSIGVHHLWVRPCFSSSVSRVWFVLLV